MSAEKSLPKGWKWVALGEVCEIKRGQSITKKETISGNIPVIAGGRDAAYFHNKANTNPPVITISGSGAYAGHVNFFNVPIFASDCSTIRINGSDSNMSYVYYCVKRQQSKIYGLGQGSAQPHVYAKDVRKIKIPLPPLAEQKRIVEKLDKQIAAIEKARQAAEKQMSESKLLPAALLRQTFPANKKLPQGWQWAKLEEVCAINPRKERIARSDEQMTTFIPMASVDGINGTVENPLIRAYKEIKKGYTYFQEGDVMFSKITPCMQNGKHFIAQKLIDTIGFASTEFHVLRPRNLIISEWVHFFVRQNHVLKEATYHFTGTAGQQRVPDDFLKNLFIPLPQLAEQKRIVAKLGEQLAAAEKCRLAAERQYAEINLMSAALLREMINI